MSGTKPTAGAARPAETKPSARHEARPQAASTEEVDIPDLAVVRKKNAQVVSRDTGELVAELLAGLRSRRLTPDDALEELREELVVARLRVMELEEENASLKGEAVRFIAVQDSLEAENEALKRENTKLSIGQWDEVLRLRREVERLRK